jgi:hypothetical protein
LPKSWVVAFLDSWITNSLKNNGGESLRPPPLFYYYRSSCRCCLYYCFLSVLNERMWMVIALARSISVMRSQRGSITATIQYPIVSHNRVIETIFARNGMALYSLKLRMYVPNLGWLSSHSYSCGDDLKYRAAEISKSGVVGSSGINIPTIPSANDSDPSMIYTVFTVANVCKKCEKTSFVCIVWCYVV